MAQGEQEPCFAYLPSAPNLALRLQGNLASASAELVGPMSERHAVIAQGRERTRARAGPDVMKSQRGLKKSRPACSA